MSFELLKAAKSMRLYLVTDFPFVSKELESNIAKLDEAIQKSESVSDPDVIYALKLAKDVILALGGNLDYRPELNVLNETIAKAEKHNWRELE